MTKAILTVSIRSEHDTVAVRQRARQIARLLGFDAQDQTRISTAVSEVARNAFSYGGGGRAEYMIEGRTAPQLFIVKISDTGPGIPNLDTILEGRYQSKTGMGLGIIGSRRLMDKFDIQSTPGKGTTVWLTKLLPARAGLVSDSDLSKLSNSLAQERPQDAFQELQHQNQELLTALEDIRTRQQELARVNRELEDTNRGVVALYAELDEKADHLRRADDLKSRFLSDMSHEFRSPLNSILALSGLLLDGADGILNSEQTQQVNFVRRSANDLLELVNDLLDIAKVEAGKVEARPIDFAVEDLFGALRGMLRPLFLNQSVDLVFEDTSKLPRLFSDEGKLSQILRNFISNALKFTEKGEVRVAAATADHDEIEFSVRDTGIGIAPENLEVIFQDFTQLDNPIQKRVKGTGLGLPLAKKLARLLDGDIHVRSTLNSGSTFTLRIPMHYRDRSDELDLKSEVWVPDSTRTPVLIVEDSPEMHMMYRRYLDGTDFQPVLVHTTREAETTLERITPKVIILDIALRSETTWAFMAKLESDPRTAGIPLLVVSTIEDQAKAYHLGASNYLLKPVTRESVLRALQALTQPPPTLDILIIDDDERDRYLLKQELRQMQARIREASSGAEGVRMAREAAPRVIFLDLKMPGMDGFETLDLLKEEPGVGATPVIVLTSQDLSDADRSRLLKKAAAIVGKHPAGREVIPDTLRRTIEGAEAGHGR